jgi:hypothetical protein
LCLSLSLSFFLSFLPQAHSTIFLAVQSEGSRSSYFILLLILFTFLVILLLLRDRVPPSWLRCLRSSASAKDDPLTAPSAATAGGGKVLEDEVGVKDGNGDNTATGFDAWMQRNDEADEAEAASNGVELAKWDGNNGAVEVAEPQQLQQSPLQPLQLAAVASVVDVEQVEVIAADDSSASPSAAATPAAAPPVAVAAETNELASPSRLLTPDHQHIFASPRFEPIIRRI